MAWRSFYQLVEPFDNWPLDAGDWQSFGSVGVANSKLQVTADPGQMTWVNYLATHPDRTVGLAFSAASAGYVEFEPYAGSNAALALLFNGKGIILYQFGAANSWTVGFTSGGNAFAATSVTTTDLFWRFWWNNSQLRVVVESSADNASWSERALMDMSSGNTGFTWDKNEITLRFHAYGGSGTVAAFRGLNALSPPPATTVTVPAAAKSSNLAPVPTPVQWTTVNAPVATVTSLAPPPTELIVRVFLPLSSVMVQALPPVIHLPVPVAMSPPVIKASNLAIIPEVIAPAPFQMFPLVASVTARFVAPEYNEILNTLAYATASSGRIEMLPPGEYVRLSVPVATLDANALPIRRAGPVFSEYAKTVVQTEQNYGGAIAYYRFSDETSTLFDSVGGYHGGWLFGPNSELEPGPIVNDPDKSRYFDTFTRGQIGLLPGFLGGDADPGDRGAEGLNGAGLGFWFYTPEGMQGERWLMAFSTWGDTLSMSLMIRVVNGILYTRVYKGYASAWVDATVPTPVNDGQWHFAFISAGHVLGDHPLHSAESAGFRIFLDGKMATTTEMASAPWTGSLFVGNPPGSENAWWEGGMDELALYDYAPSRWEVLELWNQGKALSGPPLRLEPPPLTATATSPAPTIRRSAIHPVNSFYDDFDSGVLDREKWRDASPTAKVVNKALNLPSNGAIARTPDYFQAKDSTFICRVDKLPLYAGEFFIGLVNEFDILDDSMYGGINKVDSFHRHRDIGFTITRSQRSGRTFTDIYFGCYGQSFTGPTIRQRVITYIPDDPNYPSPMKWLRLDIDGGVSGGATWYTSPDGVHWTDQYDVHGGKTNAIKSNTMVSVKNGPPQMVEEIHYVYEDEASFRLFDNDLVYPDATDWRGFMRVHIAAQGGAAAAPLVVDNVNVYPKGTGADVDILAKPSSIVKTSTSTEYLIYAMNPRVYSSAQDVQVNVPSAKATSLFVVPPEPVYVFTNALSATVAFRAPDRAGDALPVQIDAVGGTASARAPKPDEAGPAQNRFVETNQAQGYGAMLPPDEVNTDQSSPAPTPVAIRRTITLKTRRVRVSVTQN